MTLQDVAVMYFYLLPVKDSGGFLFFSTNLGSQCFPSLKLNAFPTYTLGILD